MPLSLPKRSKKLLQTNHKRAFNKEIVIITGELSGEIHAFHLVDELKAYCDFHFSGIASNKLRNIGAEIIYDYKHISITGLSEVFTKLPYIRRAFREIKKHLIKRRPSLVILVDFPGFNMRIARFAHDNGIPVIYFIPPQIWAWRKKRIHKIKEYVDRVICILPFEKAIYDGYSVDTIYVGHPFAEIVRPSLTKEDFCRAVGIDVNSPVLTIMPGSRENEVKRHMPIMMDVLEKITQKVKNLTILLPLAENIEQEKIEQYKRDGIRIVYLKGASYDALNYSNLAIIASGSATLEAAILGAPTIVIYKVSFLSYVVARLIVNVKYISLPNIIAGKEVFPEFIQTLEAEKIAEKALYMLINGREKIKNELEDIKMKLGRNNAYKLAARHIMDFLENTYGSLS